MSRIDASIKTRDGNCPASLFTPAKGEGPWPGVIFYIDAVGIRPAMQEMAQRLADNGYAVLLPDVFYRNGPIEVMDPATAFGDPAKKEFIMKLVGSLDRDRTVSDAEAFIGFLAARPEVKGDRFGVTGYCMGGKLAVTAAGAYPTRFAAIGSFHAGGLVTDQPDSPHRFLQGITGHVYVGGADNDSHFTAEQKTQLEAALTEAKVPHQVELYAGSMHGYAVPDHPAFNAQGAERHWQALTKLLAETLA
ncbi:dienelactone hydrolase family protein [Dyella acidiphila]|uniref:Dienelactone hydrolase family protein n=1 Tax=Dyella acidiphila TaxID=2775866 RepID=A0ABR9GDU0_9GAMM|nr:dienelactone hydrolase family protein [Dyella acidiphila]MBE1162203.1 dienelactone hydrolase family protein [Dyella acidiphila]